MVDKSDIKVICLTEHDLEAAWHTINAYADQSFSFTDCTTFSIMERLRISDVFTFDHHFLIYRYGLHRQKAFTCLPEKSIN